MQTPLIKLAELLIYKYFYGKIFFVSNFFWGVPYGKISGDRKKHY